MIWLANSLFQHFLAKRPHFVKRGSSWTTSPGFYLGPVMITLDLLTTNFQFTGMSPGCTTWTSFFLGWLNLLPAIFQMTVKSSSHSTVSETTSKYNSHQKSPARFFFVCRLLIIFLENIFFSVSTNCSRAIF